MERPNIDPGLILLQVLAVTSDHARYLGELLATQHYDEGVAGLIGVRRAVNQDGDVVDLDEYLRGLAQYEQAERWKTADIALKAVAAGLAERQVRLAERQGELLAGAVRRILDSLDLSPAQRALVGTVVPRELRAIEGGRV